MMNNVNTPDRPTSPNLPPGWGSTAPGARVQQGPVASRWRSDAVGVLTLVIAVLLVFAITNLGNRLVENNVRFHTGRIGETVSTPNWSVTVDRVQVGTSWSRGYGEPRRTNQIYVLVHWHVAVHQRAAVFGDVFLVTTDDVRYQSRPEAISASIPKTDPGYTSHGASLFELPAGAEQGAIFQVGPQAQFISYLTSAVRITSVLDAPEQMAELTAPATRTEVTP